MIISAKEVLKAVADWIEADKKNRKDNKSQPELGYPMFGFASFDGRDLDDTPVISEADKKLAVAEAALEAYVMLSVEKVLNNLVQSQQTPQGHPCYPEELSRRTSE